MRPKIRKLTLAKRDKLEELVNRFGPLMGTAMLWIMCCPKGQRSGWAD